MTILTCSRYHDFSAGHRVVGHESKCAMLHGHNYRVHFTCSALPGRQATDAVGRVVDFSVIKAKLCQWLEDNWDHKFLAFEDDPVLREVYDVLGSTSSGTPAGVLGQSIVWVPFNPTAENMAQYLLRVVGPQQLADTEVRLVCVRIEETQKCSAQMVEYFNREQA